MELTFTNRARGLAGFKVGGSPPRSVSSAMGSQSASVSTCLFRAMNSSNVIDVRWPGAPVAMSYSI